MAACRPCVRWGRIAIGDTNTESTRSGSKSDSSSKLCTCSTDKITRDLDKYELLDLHPIVL